MTKILSRLEDIDTKGLKLYDVLVSPRIIVSETQDKVVSTSKSSTPTCVLKRRSCSRVHYDHGDWTLLCDFWYNVSLHVQETKSTERTYGGRYESTSNK